MSSNSLNLTNTRTSIFDNIYLVRGNTYQSIYDVFIEGGDFYDKAIIIDKNFVAAFNNKGHALNALKLYEPALLAFDQALKIDPNFLHAINGKGCTLHALRQYDDGNYYFYYYINQVVTARKFS